MTVFVKNVLFVTVITLVPFVITAPQIYTTTYNFCDFELGGKKITFPDKLWVITKRDFTLHFSFCKSVQSSCRNRTASCLIHKSDEFIDFGREFISTDSDDFTLISSGGSQCRDNPHKNYTLSVNLQCSDSIKPNPRLMISDDEDDCGYEVTMMRPDCRPKCTEVLDGVYLLDIRNFTKNLQVETDSKKFSFSLCGSNRNCSNDVSACEILEKSVVPLASIDTQYLNYDVGKNELTARGRYKQGRTVRDVEVLIKCNWETDLARNIRYKNPVKQGRHYKFELESSFGCVKLPHRCRILSINNLNYDLTKLYKASDWLVAGVPEGKIFVNICGPLNQPDLCSDQHSQVCHRKNDEYINRGSILSSLKAHDDVIAATFVSGSTCGENPQLLYSTKVEFRCAKSEKGPVFREFQGCVMSLVWETPRACPIDYYTSQSCYINDRISNRNLQSLYSKTDNVYYLTPNNGTRLIYNLCGAIKETCNNHNNVSFCLKTDKNQEIVIGFDKHELISENGLLRMELEGSSCLNGKSKSEVTINFVCDYNNPSHASQIRVLEDSCKYNMTIFTRLACVSQNSFKDCTYSTENVTYDLSQLSRKNENYIISDQNVDYVFNLCGPIVTGSGALCRGDTMFCWNNRTEINVDHKYMSLGGVARPTLRNGTLIVEAKMGSYCEGLGYYMSVIRFECSNQNSSPQFVSREKCVYNFVWRTPEACPKEKKCMVDGFKPDTKLDLTRLQKKTVKVNIDNETNLYEFHLCTDTYTKYSNGTNETFSLKREYFSFEKNSYLVLDLKKKCDNNSAISKVIFEMKCSERIDDYYEKKTFQDCILNMTVHTNTMCLFAKEKHVYEIIQPETSVMKNTENGTLQIPHKIEKNCTLTNAYTGYKFNLSKIQSEEIFFKNINAVINLGGDSTKCGGIFCKNDITLVGNVCPIPAFNHTHQIVTLLFSTENSCGPNEFYQLEVVLKCNITKSGFKVLKDESCKSVLLYNLPEACSLLKENIIVAGHAAEIAGGVIGTLVVIVAIIVIFYLKRRGPIRYSLFQRNGKSAVSIYSRDCSL